jgi:hypothetical protein
MDGWMDPRPLLPYLLPVSRQYLYTVHTCIQTPWTEVRNLHECVKEILTTYSIYMNGTFYLGILI